MITHLAKGVVHVLFPQIAELEKQLKWERYQKHLIKDLRMRLQKVAFDYIIDCAKKGDPINYTRISGVLL